MIDTKTVAAGSHYAHSFKIITGVGFRCIGFLFEKKNADKNREK